MDCSSVTVSGSSAKSLSHCSYFSRIFIVQPPFCTSKNIYFIIKGFRNFDKDDFLSNDDTYRVFQFRLFRGIKILPAQYLNLAGLLISFLSVTAVSRISDVSEGSGMTFE